MAIPPYMQDQIRNHYQKEYDKASRFLQEHQETSDEAIISSIHYQCVESSKENLDKLGYDLKCSEDKISDLKSQIQKERDLFLTKLNQSVGELSQQLVKLVFEYHHSLNTELILALHTEESKKESIIKSVEDIHKTQQETVGFSYHTQVKESSPIDKLIYDLDHSETKILDLQFQIKKEKEACEKYVHQCFDPLFQKIIHEYSNDRMEKLDSALCAEKLKKQGIIQLIEDKKIESQKLLELQETSMRNMQRVYSSMNERSISSWKTNKIERNGSIWIRINNATDLPKGFEGRAFLLIRYEQNGEKAIFDPTKELME